MNSKVPKLYNLALDVIIENPFQQCFKLYAPNSNLRDDCILPAYVCDDILDKYASFNETEHDFFNLFADKTRTKLEHVRLQSSNISDNSFSIIMQHKPKSLKLDDCEFLTGRSLEEICRNCANLTILNIGQRVPIFSHELRNLKFDAPNLTILNIHECPYLPDGFVSPSTNIIHLNLTGKKEGETPLDLLGNLRSLVLHNSETEVSNFMKCEFQMRYLCHLNISNSNLSCLPCPQSVSILTRIVEFLPSLQYLDISGTDMIVHEKGTNGCTLAALNSRIGKPLEFLGICSRHICLHCRMNQSKTHNFPAKYKWKMSFGRKQSAFKEGVYKFTGQPYIFKEVVKGPLLLAPVAGQLLKEENPINNVIGSLMVASFNNIDQVLTAAKNLSFLRIIQATVILEILRFLEQYYEDNMGMIEMATIVKVLPAFFDAMSERREDLDFQQLCFSALMIIEKMIEVAVLSREEETLDEKLKKCMIKLIIDGMHEHIDDCYIIRTGCQLLPMVQALVMESYHYYDKLIILLLRIIAKSTDDLVLRGCIPIFTTVTHEFNEQTKENIVQSQVIKVLFDHISLYASEKKYNVMIMFCWLALSKLTNGMPRTCETFIEQRGIMHFTLCAKLYSNKSEVLIPMTCVISNLSKMASIRPILRKQSILEILRKILNNQNNDEPFATAKYNSMEAVIYLSSDGQQEWSVEDPSMYDMLLTITSTLFCLDYSLPSTIEYESLSHIIQLLKCDSVPQCQLWAIWVIRQLLSYDLVPYALLLSEEDGLPVIEETSTSLKNKIDNGDSLLINRQIFNLVEQVVECIRTANVESLLLEP